MYWYWIRFTMWRRCRKLPPRPLQPWDGIDWPPDPPREVRSAAERWAGYQRVLEARECQDPARLAVLARDPLRPVRLTVVGAAAIPESVLMELAFDVDSTVRDSAQARLDPDAWLYLWRDIHSS